MKLVVGTGPILPTIGPFLKQRKCPHAFLLSEAFQVRLEAFGCRVLARPGRADRRPRGSFVKHREHDWNVLHAHQREVD